IAVLWAILGLVAIILFANLAGAQTPFPGDGRPPFQSFPILGVTTNDEMVKVGDLANHALRVSLVAVTGGTLSVNVTNLPPGASTDASVQNVEVAIRESLNYYGSTFPLSGQAIAAKDPSGFNASLSVNNLGYLNVNVAAGGGSGGTSSNFVAA